MQVVDSDIASLVPKLRHQCGISRILWASSVLGQDWGLPRVKCGTVGYNLTSLAARGSIGYIVK